MKTYKLALRFASLAAIAAVASSVAVACSGDDNNSNPQPTLDSGMGSDVTMMGDDSSMGTDSSMTSDTSAPIDAPSLDTGSCKSDAGTCNSCYTAAQAAADPYNACSQYTVNCIKFDATRVPSHPTL
jgi:hypothetical protein